jgi:hypothetical protein
VTFDEWRNTYAYDARTLWAAYGAAIVSTIIAVLVGSIAMASNGVAYSANFSTILRTSQIRKSPAADDRDAEPSDGFDDGRVPLPKSLAKAIVVVNSSQRDGNLRKETSGVEEVEMVMLRQATTHESDSRGQE